MSRKDAEISSFQIWLLIVACTAFAGVVIGDTLSWHPGYSEVDEAAVVRSAWELFHQGHVPASLGTGTWYRILIGISQLIFGPWPIAVHVPAWLILLLENILLWRFARRHFGEQAAWGALLVNLLSAFSLGRGRSLLSWSALPCELLLVLELASWQGRAAPCLAGFLAGIFALDYEAWIYSGWPAVAIATAWIVRPKDRRTLAWMVAGFLPAALSCFWLSWQNLPSYWKMRGHFTLEAAGIVKKVWGESLLGLVWGGDTYPGLGSAWMHATVAPWAMPFILAGAAAAWKGRRALIAWLGCGLLLLIPPSAGLNESQRAAAAWPALCVLGGLGLEALMAAPSWNSKSALRLFALWVLAGTAWEYSAFLASQGHNSSRYYGPSRARFAAAAWLRNHGAGKLYASLGDRRAGDFEWLDSGRKEIEGAPGAALLRWEQLPALGPTPQGLHAFRDPEGEEELYLLIADGALERKLARVDGELGKFWDALPLYDHQSILRRCAVALRAPWSGDLWLRTSLWQRRMVEAAAMGRVDEALMRELRKERLLHAGPLYHPSFMTARYDLDLGAELHAQALRLDPRLAEFERNKN